MPLNLAALEIRCAQALAVSGGDAAHDIEHVRRVVRSVRAFAAVEGANLDIAVPAAWLHDCVTVPKDSPLRPKASGLAAVQALEWLRAWGWPETLLPEIAHAIEAHSFSAGLAPRTIEAKVLQDADRLEAVGAIGLARCLMLGGAMGRPLYDPADPFCEQRAADDRVSAIDHCYTKLLKLEALMQTASGRREAKQRTEFLRAFLEQLRREVRVPSAQTIRVESG